MVPGGHCSNEYLTFKPQREKLWDTSKLNHAWPSEVQFCRRLWDMKILHEEKGSLLASDEYLFTYSTQNLKDIVNASVGTYAFKRKNG